MQTRLITPKHAHHKLLVYFAGWGTPFSVIDHLHLASDTALLCCGDYRSLTLDFDFTPYTDISLVAWSMGVWVAERAMQHIPLQRTLAVNGTGLPRHDHFGIPCQLFDQTLNTLDDTSRFKFEQRMCGTRQASEHYRQLANQRPTESLQAELAFLSQAVQNDTRCGLITWQHALIGDHDRIMPTANQQNYWQNRCTVHTVQGSHNLWANYTDWSALWQ